MKQTILFALVIVMMTSCTTTKYVTVPEYHHDTLRVINHQHDSIYLHDSIRISEKGDTVMIERWHTRYVERAVHDTLYRSMRDSIHVPFVVEKEVAARLTWWQQVRLHLANVVLWLLLIVGIGFFIKKKFFLK